LPVVHGGPDGSIALYGILGDADDAIADVAGTTDVLGRRVGASSRRFARAVVNIAPDGRGLLAGGPTGFTGGAAAWWAAKLGFADVASAVAADAGSLGFSGVLVQPALTGSRFPHWDQSARGAIARTGDPDRARVMRGVQEGIAFTIRAALQAMTDSSDERQVVVALAGGSARSPRIVQLRADVTGYSVLAVRDPDAGLRGAATLGFAGLGLPRPEALVRDSRATRYDPDPALSAEYDAAFQAWSAWIAAGYRGAETFGIPPVGSS
jgi:sugar (pentulose or hexulose) kinase